MNGSNDANGIRIGWEQADITPGETVVIEGQFPARLSEGVLDPLMAAVLVMDSGDDHVIFVGCDLIYISDELQDAVRMHLQLENDCTGDLDRLDPMKVILNATHTHTGPGNMGRYEQSGNGLDSGIDLGAMNVKQYVAFAAERISEAVKRAWMSRTNGGLAYGLDYAVIGRNRRWVDEDHRGTMYGLNETTIDQFRHFEGTEDHSLNLMATYHSDGSLTGLVVNVPCPSQETESLFMISADWWHETRAELRRRFGESLFILPQCSAAGELTSHLMMEQKANERMQRLLGRSARQEVACRIADAVGRILPYISQEIDERPIVSHDVQTVRLSAQQLTGEDLDYTKQMVEQNKAAYEKELQKLKSHPELLEESRWYLPVTSASRTMNWHQNVLDRYERIQSDPYMPFEIHVIRVGDIAFATNPFECYLDFGLQIKLRSKAVQTFLVQLAGAGTYLPSPRSVAHGGYGSTPASNPVGAQGGQQLVDHTVSKLQELWLEKE